MTRVYIVEDNAHLLEDALYCLNSQGLDCYGASGASGFGQLMRQQIPDVVVLDWMLPGKSGLEIAQELQEHPDTARIGIVFMTARGGIDDRLSGLEVADSYMVKPVDYRELGAIIHCVHRRTKICSFDDAPCVLDPQQASWQISSKKLELYSPCGEVFSLLQRELTVLRELSRAYPAPVSAKTISEALGENWLIFEKNRLELLISRLRLKIKLPSDQNANMIRSVRNLGYRLMVPLALRD